MKEWMHVFHLPTALETVYTPEDRYSTVFVLQGLSQQIYFPRSIWKLALILKIYCKIFCMCTQAFGRTYF